MANAQIAINLTGAAPNASAALDVDWSSKGILIPRVALTSTNDATTISSPATSLLVYNTATAGTPPNNVTPGYYYWNGTRWIMLIGNDRAWSLNGNAGTVDGTNFIGTTDNIPFNIRVNNQRAGRITGAGATIFGYQAANSNTSSSITAIGYQSLFSNTSGNNNIAIGNQSMYSNSTGYSNVAIGHNAMRTNSSGHSNVLIGSEAGYYQTTAIENTFIGARTGYFLQSGSGNTAIGCFALYCYSGSGGGPLPGGSNNVAIGKWAMFNPASGNGNVAIGMSALSLTNSGSENVMIGFYADKHTVSSTNYSIALGSRATVNADNAVAIGYRAYAPNANTVIIGGINGTNGATVTSNVGIGTTAPAARLHVVGSTLTSVIFTNSGGGHYTDWPTGWGGGISTWDINCAGIQASVFHTRSDERLKKNISTIQSSVLDKISLIRPVTYQFVDSIEEPGLIGRFHYGFIAQELETIFPQLVSDNVNGYKSINYIEMIPILTKAIKELIDENKLLKKQNTEILEKLNNLLTK